ncbi:TPA: multidrug ABC transporter substrate-binding protein [Candidatus Dependentiae bacterium]|nr:multidrug ABC transporter substrate-binding protein [Candidatus Dependentiae bacterium]
MNSLVLLRTSVTVFFKHPVRSFLTILGIAIGISAIIATFAIGRGAEMRIRSQIMSMGENAAYIIPGNVFERGRVRATLGTNPRLTKTDVCALKEQIPQLRAITGGFDVLEPIVYKSASSHDRIFGTTAEMITVIQERKLAKGELFGDYHRKYGLAVIVLGSELANILFKDEDPIGKTIRIGRTPFLVLGVLEPYNNYFGNDDPNKKGFIPDTTAQKYFKKNDKTLNDVDFIVVKFGKEAHEGETLRKIIRVLRQTHNIRPGDLEDFTIFDQQSIANSAATASDIIQLFGLIAASISLLVGGIGIMNIMLVSVQERTREIGIRLALGATQGTIQAQFLIEAATLCFVGGIVGIVAGLGISALLSILTNLPGFIETEPIFVALFITLIIGLVFGYYPARKASLMDPVKALYNL